MRFIELCEARPAIVTAYHGTSRPIDGSFRAGFARGAGENAIFFTDERSDAVEFSVLNPGGRGIYVYRAELDISRFSSVDYEKYQTEWFALQGDSNDTDADLYIPQVMAELITSLRKHRYQGVVIHGVRNFEAGMPTVTYAVFDPRAILSVELDE